MSEGPGFLEFFILEASDYVEQLDGLLLTGGSSGPDAEALQRVARALRGTATMAKLPSFASLAGAVERVGRAMHEGALPWDPALGGALVAAIDDLKVLLHAARTWSADEDRRAKTRVAELARHIPVRPAAAAPGAEATPAAASAASFLATEAANIAAGLELLTTRAADSDTAANVLRRIRALRGVAGVKEVGPLADVLEATEDAGRALEMHEELSPEARRLLETAAAYMRTLASALRTGADINAPSPARHAFDAACEAWSIRTSERDRVIPISHLFYADDPSGLVEASRHPPTSAAERFRLELVSLGEHLRQVVDAARQAKDPASRARIQRELRRALHALESAAESFGQDDVAAFIRAHGHAADNLDFLGLGTLDDLASLLAEPGVDGQRLRARLNELSSGREIATSIGAGFGHETPLATPAVSAPAAPMMPRVATPARAATPPAPRISVPPKAMTPPAPRVAVPVKAPTPAEPRVAIPARVTPAAPQVSLPVSAGDSSGSKTATPAKALNPSAAALIDSGIAALESFTATPMLPPTPLTENLGPVVPIESLLYRGRAALDRAVQIRDQIRRTSSSPDPDALDELFDLIELARVD